MRPLRPEQRKLYEFLLASRRESGRPPTLREVAEQLGTTPGQAKRRIEGLVKRGLVRFGRPQQGQGTTEE